MRDIALEFVGGGTPEHAQRVVPENVKGYPGSTMFGSALPAYGFFVRHVKNIVFANVHLRFATDDHRPAVVCDDVDGVTFTRLQAQTMPGIDAQRLINTRNVTR